VVYTPAKPFNRNRFLLRLVTVAAIVVAMVLGISIFFKVDVVTVSGAEKYTPFMVQEASGIKAGDNLLTLDKVRASGRIIAALPYVDTVRIGIQLPDTVNIEIKEMDVVYSIKDSSGAWWLVNADGRVIVNADSATAGSHAQIVGVVLHRPVSGQQAEASDVEVSLGDANQTAQNISGASRLSAALSILQYLEDNSIMGLVESVDVEDLADIELWYGQQYQVRLGDSSQLSYKIRCMCEAIAQLKDYDTGLLDISFMLIKDQVIYEPFLE
jgi:cell division protein FtsQ